jgi:hypothetical protein
MPGMTGPLALVELPFLLITVVFGILTANALKGGVFGRSMVLIASGAAVMGVGHLHLLAEALFNVNLFQTILGPVGSVVWIVALVASWGLSGFGFYSMYRVSQRA